MIITRIIDFPDATTKAMCILDSNGDYNIYINARVSAANQAEGYLHELKHIARGDFDKFSVQTVELEVRNEKWVS